MTIYYCDKDWNCPWLTMDWETLKELNADKSGADKNDWEVYIEEKNIIYLYVYLDNTVSGSTKRVRVNLSEIVYCEDPDGSDGYDGASFI